MATIVAEAHAHNTMTMRLAFFFCLLSSSHLMYWKYCYILYVGVLFYLALLLQRSNDLAQERRFFFVLHSTMSGHI